jgi:hypothetical protein
MSDTPRDRVEALRRAVADGTATGVAGTLAGLETLRELFRQRDALLAVAEEWLNYFDRLNERHEEDDPLRVQRIKYHAKRVAMTREAIAATREIKP